MFYALVDTGSEGTLLSKKIFDVIEEKLPTEKFKCAGAIGVTSEALPICFGVTLPLQIGNLLIPTEVQVSEKLPYDMILGMNVLQKHFAKVYCDTQQLEIMGEVIQGKSLPEPMRFNESQDSLQIHGKARSQLSLQYKAK